MEPLAPWCYHGSVGDGTSLTRGPNLDPDLPLPAASKQPLLNGVQEPEPEATGPLRILRTLSREPHGRLCELDRGSGRRLVGRVMAIAETPEPKILARWDQIRQAVEDVAGARLVSCADIELVEDTENGLQLACCWPALRGQALDSLSQPLERRLAVRLVADAARALAYAHGRGIYHFSLAPQRLLLSPGGVIRVMETGVGAALLAVEKQALAHIAAGFAGPYVAPEVASGQEGVAGRAADVFSLAAVLLDLLRGEGTHSSDSADEHRALLEQRAGDQIPDPTGVQPPLHAALSGVLQRALSLRPTARQSDLGELADQLEAWLGDDPIPGYFPDVKGQSDVAPVPPPLPWDVREATPRALRAPMPRYLLADDEEEPSDIGEVSGVIMIMLGVTALILGLALALVLVSY